MIFFIVVYIYTAESLIFLMTILHFSYSPKTNHKSLILQK